MIKVMKNNVKNNVSFISQLFIQQHTVSILLCIVLHSYFLGWALSDDTVITDMLCASSFVDDVMFAYSGPLWLCDATAVALLECGSVLTTATAPVCEVEAVVRSPTKMATAKIVATDFNKITSK